MALALLTLAVDLAPTSAKLTEWGREHTALIDAQPDAVFSAFRAHFAQAAAGLRIKETR